MATLVILTSTFPFEGVTESAFIRPEIKPLAEKFNRVIIAPLTCVGQAEALPDNVEIDCSLTSRPGIAGKALTAILPQTWRRINDDGRYIHSLSQLRGALAETTYVTHFRRAIKKMIEQRGLDLGHTLFYSFWFDFRASALAALPGVKFVSRAHGFDVYDHRNKFLSHSRRAATLNRAKACYAASDAARDYMRADYPEASQKIVTRPLGSADATRLNPGPPTIATVLSVARCTPEKGVDRLALSLRRLAERNPERPLRWIHVGDGAQLEQLKQADYGSLKVDFRGQLTNSEVAALMQTEPVTFFALLSRSEGGRPVAAAEALAHGIPVVASDVGGVGEIIDSEVGILLSPNPVPEEFCDRVGPLLDSFDRLRAGARRRWEERCDARSLREEFANEIRREVP